MSTQVTPAPSPFGDSQEPLLFGPIASGSFPHHVGPTRRAEEGSYPHPGAGRAGRARALPPPSSTPPEELDHLIQLVEQDSDSIEEVEPEEYLEQTTPQPEFELVSDDAVDLGSFEDCEATPGPELIDPPSPEEMEAKPLVSVPLPPLPTAKTSPPPMPGAMPPRLAIAADQLAAKLLQPSASSELPPPIPASSRRARATLPPPFWAAGARPTEEVRDTPTPQRLITERDIDLASLPDPLPAAPEVIEPSQELSSSELIIAPELAGDSNDDDTIPVIGHEGRLDDSWFDSQSWQEKESAKDGTEVVDATASPQRVADHRRRLFAGSLVGVAVVAFAIGALVTSRSNGTSAAAAGQVAPAPARTQVAQGEKIPQPVAVPLAATKPQATETAPAVAPEATPIEEPAKPVDPETLEALDMLAPEHASEHPVVAAADDSLAAPTVEPKQETAQSVKSAEDRAIEARMPPRRATTHKKSHRRVVEHQRKSRRAARTQVATASSGKRGTLMIGAKPPCRLYVDGKYVGTTPQRALHLPAGSHRVVLRNKEHKISKGLTVNIKAGKKTKVIRDYM